MVGLIWQQVSVRVCVSFSIIVSVNSFIHLKKKTTVPVLGAEDSGEDKVKSMSARELMFWW